jgi:hypothetical protein
LGISPTTTTIDDDGDDEASNEEGKNESLHPTRLKK